MDKTMDKAIDNTMDKTIFRSWWLLLIRGIFAVLFGVLTFIRPGASLFALVILFGVFAVISGVSNLALAMRTPRVGPRWGSLIFEGIVGLFAGLVTLVWPTTSALALIMVIAVWAVATGITSIMAAIRLRKQIKGEWLLALNGVLSIALGVLLFLFPRAGALAFMVWVGAFAVVSGIVLIALAFRLRAWGRTHPDETAAPHLPVRPPAPA